MCLYSDPTAKNKKDYDYVLRNSPAHLKFKKLCIQEETEEEKKRKDLSQMMITNTLKVSNRPDGHQTVS